jgi:hypothetical protein
MTPASNQRCIGPWFEFLLGLSGSSVGMNDDSPLFVLYTLLLVAVVVQLAFHCLFAVVSLSDSRRNCTSLSLCIGRLQFLKDTGSFDDTVLLSFAHFIQHGRPYPYIAIFHLIRCTTAPNSTFQAMRLQDQVKALIEKQFVLITRTIKDLVRFFLLYHSASVYHIASVTCWKVPQGTQLWMKVLTARIAFPTTHAQTKDALIPSKGFEVKLLERLRSVLQLQRTATQLGRLTQAGSIRNEHETSRL